MMRPTIRTNETHRPTPDEWAGGRTLGLDGGMHVDMSTPTVDQLDAVVAELSSWQQEGLPVQLHPGDSMGGRSGHCSLEQFHRFVA